MPLPIYDGAAWVNSTPQIYNGSAWTPVVGAYVYDGTQWTLVFSAVEFDNPPGTYSRSGTTTASFQINASQTVVWTYTKSGASSASATPVSGGSQNFLKFQVSTTTIIKSASLTNVFATYNGISYGPWTINLDVG